MYKPKIAILESGTRLGDRFASAQSYTCRAAKYFRMSENDIESDVSADLIVIFADEVSSLKDCLTMSLHLRDNPAILVVAGNLDIEEMEYSLAHDVIDYVSIDDAVESVEKVLQRLEYISKHRDMVPWQELSDSFNIIGSSPLICKCQQKALKAAQSDVGVLIHGETGTGKELFARAIHGLSNRSKGNLVVVDCASIPTSLVGSILFGHKKGSYTGAVDTKNGLIQRADGGTLFLDEISELPLDAQKALLRVLQEKKFLPVGGEKEVSSNFRIVAATNKDLSKMAKENLFRLDLLFRIQSFKLMLPPLRDRENDIYELASHFARESCKKYKINQIEISDEVLREFSDYDWPGNVRELQNVVSSAVMLAWGQPQIYPEHLPHQFRINFKKKMISKRLSANTCFTCEDYDIPKYKAFRDKIVESAEKQYFNRLIAESQGNLEKAMELSGLRKARLYELLKYNGLSLARFRNPLAHSSAARG